MEAKPGSDATPEASIRTFLIADVRGYTLFTAERGDEAAARLATRFASVAREGVETHGGTVVELRGDEALAVFDSARQAIRAALELQRRFVEETITDPRLPLPVGIGLDAGEAVPVEGGYRGGALNLAARLCSIAGPAEVLASREVVHLARKVEGVAYVDRGTVRVKGVPEPVHVTRVHAEAADVADDVAFRQALGSTGALLAPAGPDAVVHNPYKGLRPFEETDAADFFGRDALTQQLVDRLAETRFLAVVGPSGSGKSSVVRAGLIPALRKGAFPGSDEWVIVDMFPGARPLEELEAVLLRVAVNPPSSLLEQLEGDDRGLLRAVNRVLPADRSELLLVVDQFEEVFTLVEDEVARTHFLESLERAATDPNSRVRVVVTLRADFYDRPLLYRGFAELLRTRVEVVVPLSPEEIEQAISGPARRVDVRLEPGVEAAMLTEIADEPGGLPLLQYALTELFERREGNILTLDSYRAIGGVSGALGRRAEELFEGLEPKGQEAARQLFLRLVALGEGTEDTRRPVPRSELDSLDVEGQAMASVIEAYGTSRLLSFDRDSRTGAATVEVAHEALLSAWTRLRRWIDDAREDVRTERRLAAATRDWLEADRDPSFLVSGSRLEQLETWLRTSDLSITPDEREFVEASSAERDRRRSEEEAREVRERDLERRSVRRLRTLVAVLTVAALIAGGLTVFAFAQRGRAERENRIAVARELAAASVANLEADPERSILLALEAIEQTRSADGSVLPEAEEALHRAMGASRIVRSVPGLGGWVDWSPDGTRFVTEGPEETGEIDIRNAETGESMLSFHGHERDVNGVAFNADGSMLLTTGDDGTAKVWNPLSGRELGRIEDPDRQTPVTGPSFSADGSLAAAAWPEEGTVRVWEVTTSRIVHEIELEGAFRTTFSPDGERLAIVGFDLGVVVDVRSGDEVLTLEGHEGDIQDVDWSPDGRWISTSSFDATAGIWDAETGDLRFSLFHDGFVTDADWSPQSDRLVTGGSQGTVWGISEGGGEQLFSLSAQDTSSGVQGVAFSPDGTKVLTGDTGITSAKIWDVDLTGDAEWATLPGEPDWVTSVAFSPSGRELITSGPGGTVVEWDPETGETIHTLETSGSTDEPPTIVDLDLSPDGARIATMSFTTEPVVGVWDRSTGQEVFSFDPGGFAENLDWSPDGRLLAIGGMDAEAAIIVDSTGEEIARLDEEPGKGVFEVQFSPDGQRLATASLPTGRPDPLGQRVKIWDWESGEIVTEIPINAEGIAFDPSGERIAIAYGGEAAIWDVDTGKKQTTFSGHQDILWDVAYSPDGSQLATGGFDNTVRLWDAESGVQLLVLRGHDLVVGKLAFSPDGSKLASGAGDGTARVWALELDDLVDLARQEVTRSLTPQECRQYLHGDCPEG
jgi:WD40 repeat protein/class 3 adenylate cyclase